MVDLSDSLNGVAAELRILELECEKLADAWSQRSCISKQGTKDDEVFLRDITLLQAMGRARQEATDQLDCHHPSEMQGIPYPRIEV